MDLVKKPELIVVFLLFFLFCFAGRGLAVPIQDDLSIYMFPFAGLLALAFRFKKTNIKPAAEYPLTLKIYIVMCFCFLGLSMVSVFYSPAPSYGFSKQSLLALFFVIFLLFSLSLKTDEIITFRTLFSLALIPLCIYYILIFIQSGFSVRQGIAGAGSITTGRLFAFSFICAFYAYLHYRNKFFILISILLMTGVFISGSRGNLLFLLVAIIAPLSISRKKDLVKLLAFITVALAIALSLYDITEIPYFYRYQLIFEGGGDSILYRFSAFETATSAFLENPILGLGAGGFAEYSMAHGKIEYPHSVFFEVAAEQGTVGLLFFIMILLSAFCFLRKDNVTLSIFIFYLLSSSVSGDLFDARILICSPLLSTYKFK